MIFLYDSIVDKSTVAFTANSIDSQYGVGNVTDFHISNKYRSTLSSTVWVTADLGSTENSYDMTALIGHNITSTATVALYGATSTGFGVPNFTETLTATTNAIYKTFTAKHRRYVRWKINDAGNPDGYIEIGRAMLGEKLTLNRDFSPAFTEQHMDTSDVNFSITGQPFGVGGYRTREYDLDFPYWTDATKQDLDTMYEKVHKYIPLFCVLDDNNSTKLKPVHAVIASEFKPSHRTDYQWYGRMTLRESR